MKYALCLMLLYSLTSVCVSLEVPEEEWIIFIHGTLGLRHNFEWKTFLTLFRDDINNTPYQKTIDILRDDPFYIKIKLFKNEDCTKST